MVNAAVHKVKHVDQVKFRGAACTSDRDATGTRTDLPAFVELRPRRGASSGRLSVEKPIDPITRVTALVGDGVDDDLVLIDLVNYIVWKGPLRVVLDQRAFP